MSQLCALMTYIRKKLWVKLLFNCGKRTQEDLQLTRSLRDSPTPAAVVKALEFELSEGGMGFARLGQEYQRVKAEVRTLTGAKMKLEAEIRGVRELLGVQEKDLDETRAKVS